MTNGETLGRDAGGVRSRPATRPVDAAVFQIVPGAMAGEVRRDGGQPRAEDRARQEAALRRLMKPIARAHAQASARTKQRRLVRLKHLRQVEEVAGMIALRAMVAMGSQWVR